MEMVTTKKNKADKIRTKIYVKIFPEKNEVIYSGIEFTEFLKYSPQPIENLMVISGGNNFILPGTKCERGFELFEGYGLIEKLTKENVYNLGDFCFVDYVLPCKTSELNEMQIAELLYLGHMFKPLHAPFFELLNNNFAYLAHDDGWYCKLYCRNLFDFMTVLCKKIVANIPNGNACKLSDDIEERMLQLAIEGLLIDLDELSHKDKTVNIYSVGTYSDMDVILNNYQQIKLNATKVNKLNYNEKMLTIMDD